MYLKDFEKYNVTVIKGQFRIKTLYLLCINSVLNGRDAIFIDGSNTFNPYIISKMAKSFGLDQKNILRHIHIARAFTEYQMKAIVLDLNKIIQKNNPEMLAISNLTFYHNSDPHYENYDNFEKLIEHIKDITKSTGIITVISNFDSNHNSYIESKADKILNVDNLNIGDIMGRTIPSFRYHLEDIIAELQIFRRALYGEDKTTFDNLIEKARRHAPSCTIVPTSDPLNCILLSILIEQQKEIDSLKSLIKTRESQ